MNPIQHKCSLSLRLRLPSGCCNFCYDFVAKVRPSLSKNCLCTPQQGKITASDGKVVFCDRDRVYAHNPSPVCRTSYSDPRTFWAQNNTLWFWALRKFLSISSCEKLLHALLHQNLIFVVLYQLNDQNRLMHSYREYSMLK